MSDEVREMLYKVILCVCLVVLGFVAGVRYHKWKTETRRCAYVGEVHYCEDYK